MQHSIQPYIRYPHGAGGSWLASLVWQMQNLDYAHDPGQHINFHDVSGINSGHDAHDDRDIVFSGRETFNFFLNFWWKKRVFENYQGFNDLCDFDKMDLLSQEARWIMYSPNYAHTYLDRIDIEWKLLWHHPTQFKKILMRAFDIAFSTAVDSLIDTYMASYKKTCVDAKHHLGNPYSLPWLSWCYATIIEHQIDLAVAIQDSRDIPRMARYLNDQGHRFLDLALPLTLMIERN